MEATTKSPEPPRIPHLPNAESANDHLLSGGITIDLPIATPPVPVAVRESNGRFKRGAPSPNPSGRAAVGHEVKEAARAYTTGMLSVLVEVAMDSSAPPAARVAAANAVLDRGHGRPNTNIEAKIAKVDVGAMHLEALRTLNGASPHRPQDAALIKPYNSAVAHCLEAEKQPRA